MLGQGKTMLFVCDMQTRFSTLIYGFEHVVNTCNKMLQVAKVLGIGVVVTEQNPRALGTTSPEIDLASLGTLCHGPFPKTLFSMYVGKVKDVLLSERPQDIILLGIESHVCVLQTALDLIQAGYTVHLLADGVSSCNKEEIPIALSRIKQAGGFVTTSESAAFQLMVDSDTPKFKPFSSTIKEAKESTENALKAMTDVGPKSLL